MKKWSSSKNGRSEYRRGSFKANTDSHPFRPTHFDSRGRSTVQASFSESSHSHAQQYHALGVLAAMGADQSRPADDGPSTPASGAAGGSEDFYTLLEVDDGAGELEIKVSLSSSSPYTRNS